MGAHGFPGYTCDLCGVLVSNNVRGYYLHDRDKHLNHQRRQITTEIVAQEGLDSFRAAADELRVKGLSPADTSSSYSEVDPTPTHTPVKRRRVTPAPAQIIHSLSLRLVACSPSRSWSLVSRVESE